MPATTAYSSQTSNLKVSISSVMTHIPQIDSISGPSIVTDLNDITNLDSPNSFKEFLPVLKDGGTVQCAMVYNPSDTTQQYIQNSNFNSTLESFELDLSTTTHKLTFSAYVTKFESTEKKGDALRVNFELKVTGPVVFA